MDFQVKGCIWNSMSIFAYTILYLYPSRLSVIPERTNKPPQIAEFSRESGTHSAFGPHSLELSRASDGARRGTDEDSLRTRTKALYILYVA